MHSNAPLTGLHIQPDILDALASDIPVVALESALITHGLPPPHNLQVAELMAAAVREAGAVPAIMAVIDGKLSVGLDREMLGRLSVIANPLKISMRDLPVAMATGGTGGTTVAASMHLAHAGGIRVFATGGIGGVHRGCAWDVSNDLNALATLPVTVVCSGAKAILDLPLTMEALETRGVTVAGYQTSEFPAFYCRSSGLPVDIRCDNPSEVAALVHARDLAGLSQAVLIAQPIPPGDALPAEDVEAAISRALDDAEREGVKGYAITPYLLHRISLLTDTRSLHANMALLANNARLAAEIAGALLND